MTTSGVTTFNVTRNEIIDFALENIKAYAPDFETVPPAVYVRVNKRLNMMIKAMQAAGVGLWLNTVYTQVLVAAAQSYSLGPASTPTAIPRPLGVVEARLVDVNGNEQIMSPMSRDEYMALPLKSSTGSPNQYYYDPQLVNGVFYAWPVATDLTSVIKMTVRTPVQDFVNTDDTPDFPIEWADALHYSLAMRLLSVYDVPDKIANRVREMAAITLKDANDFDREQGVTMQIIPDMGPGR
jgi:hypothetical protein